MYGIPFRSDARFEMYNSSGYAYNANSRILYVKMRHRSEYETIRLSLGTAPQASASAQPEQAGAASNTNAVADPSADAPATPAAPTASGQTEKPAQSAGSQQSDDTE